ncbi:MAG: EAL domain-containing protein [Marinobacter sp.]|uniref:sensor domain-containing phosphodiesterase n=1 Tax=Marinobacter sp. TaxID=50741 RepID=UPI00299EF017|nr:EAL domain-containing protein [Marinobacter sp.]MDX1635166.1 EAL domain-containing protein [Marinobacter sp.]
MSEQNAFIPSARSRPVTVVCLSVLLLLTAELSRLLTVEGQTLSAIWPPAGIMLGAALALGAKILLPLGAVLLGWLIILEQAPLSAALVSSVGQVSAAWLGSHLIRSFWVREAFQPLTAGVALYTRGALAGGGLAAAIGTLSLFVSGSAATEHRFYDVFLGYWIFEAVSVLLFAPLTFYCLLSPRRFLHEVQADLAKKSIAIWSVIVLLILLLTILLPSSVDASYTAGLGFAQFALLSWLVVSANRSMVILVIPLFAIMFVAFSIQGHAGLPRITAVEDLVRSIMFLAGLVVLTQMMASVNAERNRTLEVFRQQANTDFLTGLANDRSLAAQIQSRLADPGDGQQFWLVHLEVLDFDQIEDLMGFRSRRTLETLLAARLMGTMGPDVHPARIGDGIFALVCRPSDSRGIAGKLSELYDAFNDQNFSAGVHSTRIRVALGAVPLDGKLGDHSQYLSAATQAALMAREQLPRTQVMTDVEGLIESRKSMTERLELLKDALSNDRLVLFAQPICPIGRDDEGITYEILLRLQDDQGALLGPGAFLPIAEAFGFMREIDQWVITTTLNTLASNPEWQQRTRKCSINLAGTSMSSENLVAFIRDEFERTGVDPRKIGFEITETQLIASRDVAEEITRQLRRLGCSVALDDFGTGLASFDYLKSFDFDMLKIDGVFVKNLESNSDDRRIVRSTCDVAREMGLKTVAEFVETDAIAQLLGELGVDYAQGFGLGRPVAVAALFEACDQLAAAAKQTIGDRQIIDTGPGSG